MRNPNSNFDLDFYRVFFECMLATFVAAKFILQTLSVLILKKGKTLVGNGLSNYNSTTTCYISIESPEYADIRLFSNWILVSVWDTNDLLEFGLPNFKE
jgi:hypothetical protein